MAETNISDEALHNTSNAICEADINPYVVCLKLGCLAFSVVENFIILLASIIDRTRLKRQNKVYLCIISNLMNNFLLSLFPILLDVRDLVYPKYVYKSVAGIMTPFKIMEITFLSSSFTFMFAICGNVIAIIFVLLDGGSFIGPRNVATSNKNDVKWYHKTKMRVAIGMVVFAWFLPLLMIALAVHFMNCVKDCQCEMIKVKGLACPRHNSCSTVFIQLTKPFMILNTSIWFVQVFGLCVFLAYAVSKYKKSFRYVSRDSKSSTQCTIERRSVGFSTLDRRFGNNREVIESNGNLSVASTTVSSNSPSNMLSKTTFRFNKRFNFTFLITGLHIFCTLPLAIIVLLDFFVSLEKTANFIRILNGILTFLYTTLSPVAILVYMPTFAISVRSMFLSIKRLICCHCLLTPTNV